jgi:hypothetical protein
MRELIEVTLECVSTGEVTREFAARNLSGVGVPLSVIGRVLATSTPTEPRPFGTTAPPIGNFAPVHRTPVLSPQSAA